MPPGEVDDAVLVRLAATVGSVPAFDCVFARTAWFNDDVVWLAPEPDGPLRDLTSAVVTAFPAHQPYGGAYAEPTPHLTIGERRLGSVAELRAAETAVGRHLPVRARIRRTVLMAGRPEAGSWQVVETFDLGPPAEQGSAAHEPGSDPGVPRWSAGMAIGRLAP